MHPVNRVICFLVVSFFLTRASHIQLAAYAAMLCLYLVLSPVQLAPLLKMIWRLKWFFVSILAVYLLIEPGAQFTHYTTDLVQAFSRIALLCMLMATVYVLVLRIPRDELMGCVYWICYPFKWIGVQPDRVALRSRMIVESVSELQKEFSSSPPGVAPENTGRLQRLATQAAYWFTWVENRAEAAALDGYPVVRLSAPKLKDWMTCLVFFIALQLFSVWSASW